MRRFQTMIGVAIAAMALVVGFPALAFHDGGVADCSGCHTMHNSQDGALVDPESPDGNEWLLIRSSPSDVCLNCHGSRLGEVFGDNPLSPPPERGGGNFVFLLEDNINDGHGGADDPIPGDSAGHTIVSPDRGVGPDSILTTAPGGTFSSMNLGCSSCHDPHGNESFRLLYGAGPVQDGLYNFTEDAPEAIGLAIFGAPESNSNHTAYQSGMAAWCGNCHGNFHQNGNSATVHPAGAAIGGTIASIYNQYNGTSDQTGGVAATAYLPQVPFEDPSAATDSTAGPSGSSQVTCVTCHRGHATSAADAGRWDFQVTFLHEDGEESGSYPIPDPYNDLNQRSLCNKCHNKDQGDELPFENPAL
jgi:hypothetical protein